MTVRLGPLIVEATDPEATRRFWAAALGDSAYRRHLIVKAESSRKVVKNRVHLDVYVRDPASLLSLGARVLAEYLPEWVTMADVDGNEFCAFIDPAVASDPPARVFAVCTDSERPEELAQWWATRVGAEVSPGPDGTLRWLYDAAGWTGVTWKFVRVADERAAPNRWQWSVSGDTADLVVAGADQSGDGRLVDPDGNEFSLQPAVRPTG